MSVKEKADQLVEELETINRQAFRMAFSVHHDSSSRSQLEEEARLLQKRLLNIAEELERIDPDIRKRWFHPISESILDLDFVVTETDITSLRLGDIIRWGK